MKEINKKIFCIFLLFFSQFGLLGEEIISSIKIQIVGAPTVSESFVKQNLQVQENAIYQSTLIDKSIQNLMETGSFKDVKVYRLNNKKTEVSLLFKVYPNPKISEILFEGNVLDLRDDKTVDEIFKGWSKDKKLPDSFTEPIVNTILNRCNVQALIMSKELNLPPPIPMPKVGVSKPKK